jgi:polyhydroxyalkanoate synthesis regulator phasin
MRKNTLKAKQIVEELFFDEHVVTQWQYELLAEILNIADEVVKNYDLLAIVSNSFSHEIIEKIRNSKSDAEARRYIKQHIKNCC